jgi:DNA-binding transcriptional MerR regulator
MGYYRSVGTQSCGRILLPLDMCNGLRIHICGACAYNMIDVYVNCHSKQKSRCLSPGEQIMPTYTITELAHEFDITPRAIRFYEDQGLISPRRDGASGRVRIYSARERTRLKLTLRGKRLGLRLSQIKSLVDMYESPKDSMAQLQLFLTILAQHRQMLEQQREDLDVTLAEIAAHEAQCRRILENGKAAGPAQKPAAKRPAASSTKQAG